MYVKKTTSSSIGTGSNHFFCYVWLRFFPLRNSAKKNVCVSKAAEDDTAVEKCSMMPRMCRYVYYFIWSSCKDIKNPQFWFIGPHIGRRKNAREIKNLNETRWKFKIQNWKDFFPRLTISSHFRGRLIWNIKQIKSLEKQSAKFTFGWNFSSRGVSSQELDS